MAKKKNKQSDKKINILNVPSACGQPNGPPNPKGDTTALLDIEYFNKLNKTPIGEVKID